MTEPGLQRARAFLCLGLLLSSLVPAAHSAEEPDNRPQRLYLATYEMTVLSRQETGAVLWLTGPQADLRMEVLRQAAPLTEDKLVAKILQQEGQGWTAILNGQGDETLNRWGERWQFPPAGLGAAVGFMTGALEQGPPEVKAPQGPWRSGKRSPQTSRQVIGSLLPKSRSEDRFRQKMASRGYGRGGDEDVMQLLWQQNESPGADLRITASKWPGELQLHLIAVYEAQIAFPEVFVPLWPLAELVEIRENADLNRTIH